MKFSIQGDLKKVRFHIRQDFLHNSMLCLHSNLLTDIDMEKKKRKKSFSHQPLTKPFENILSTFSHYFFSPLNSPSYLPSMKLGLATKCLPEISGLKYHYACTCAKHFNTFCSSLLQNNICEIPIKMNFFYFA